MAKAFKASAAEPADAHSCHQHQYPRRLMCRWAGPQPRLDTVGRGLAIACLTTFYDTGLRYRDTIFSHDTSPTQLTVQDLWDNPAEVADFLNLDS